MIEEINISNINTCMDDVRKNIDYFMDKMTETASVPKKYFSNQINQYAFDFYDRWLDDLNAMSKQWNIDIDNMIKRSPIYKYIYKYSRWSI